MKDHFPTRKNSSELSRFLKELMKANQVGLYRVYVMICSQNQNPQEFDSALSPKSQNASYLELGFERVEDVKFRVSRI